jgi:lytic murein transglycosylase
MKTLLLLSLSRTCRGVALVLTLAACTSTPLPKTAPTAPAGAGASAQQEVETVAGPAQQFARWVADFSADARANGIDEATLQEAFANVRFLPRVIELDRAQPEFNRTVWAYLDSAVSSQRIARGQEKLRLLQAQVDPIAARYGVPTEVLFAFWGVESNFGSNLGDISTIDALATLAYEGRRGTWARTELMAALKILQNHDIARTRMLGSWAGAMGQTQFMPSVFLAYAVDGDGDGRRDLWDSFADVMASSANFVSKSGWQPGETWGVEVRLPSGFDYERADPSVRQSASEWASLGVQAVDGAALPPLASSSVLLPAGARGPAFLVGNNFRTILKYNNSTSYALAVGLLAQQLKGAAPVQASWPCELLTLSRSQMQTLQTLLNAQGFNTGTPDGQLGPATQAGIRQYQRSRGLAADGYPSLELLQGLQGEGGVRP